MAPKFFLEAAIPPNTTATVYLPAKADAPITESEGSIDQAADVKLLRRENDCAVIAVPSGRYRFESRL